MRSCGCACSDHPYFRTTHNARRPDAAAYPQHINDLDGRQLTVALYAMALCWRGLSRRRPLPAQYLLHYRLASRRTCAAPPPPGAFSSGEHSPRTGHPVRRWCVGSRSVLHTASATARRRTVSERRIPPGATAGPCSLQMHCCCPPRWSSHSIGLWRIVQPGGRYGEPRACAPRAGFRAHVRQVHRGLPRERPGQWPRTHPKCFGTGIFVVGGRAYAPWGPALPGGAPGALAKGVVHLISCASPCFCAAGHLQKHALHR